jgi:hypothetical protein
LWRRIEPLRWAASSDRLDLSFVRVWTVALRHLMLAQFN